jgi:hypothetical protein
MKFAVSLHSFVRPQNEILGDVAFGSTKSLAFHADDFYR